MIDREPDDDPVSARRSGETRICRTRGRARERRSGSFSFGVRRMRRCFTRGAVTTSMAMGVGIQKMSERRPTNEVVCPSTNSASAACRRASASCRCNTPSSACHLSGESVRSNLSAARFVGECLSDTCRFDSVGAYVDMHTHDAHTYTCWYCVRSFSPCGFGSRLI